MASSPVSCRLRGYSRSERLGRCNSRISLRPKTLMVPRDFAFTKSLILISKVMHIRGLWRTADALYLDTGVSPRLGFCDVMLTGGLARDGRPSTCPKPGRLAPETIAGFFGRPYLGSRGSMSKAVRLRRNLRCRSRRMTKRPTQPSVIPRCAARARPRPNQFVLGFSRADAGVQDVARQLISRLLDRCWAQRSHASPTPKKKTPRGPPPPTRGRNLGDTGAPVGRCVRRSRQCRSHRAVSAGRNRRRAAADDTNDGCANVHAWSRR